MTGSQSESNKYENQPSSPYLKSTSSPNETLIGDTLPIVDCEAIAAEVLAELVANETREHNEIIEAVERDIAEQERRNAEQKRLEALASKIKPVKQIVAVWRASAKVRRANIRQRVIDARQERIKAWRQGPGREQYNAENREYYQIMIEMTEGRTVRPSTNLKDMTAEEKADYKREHAKERKRKQRAAAAKAALK